MGLRDRLSAAIDTDGSDADTATVTYRCQHCPTLFEDRANADPQCPECGTGRVAVVEE